MSTKLLTMLYSLRRKFLIPLFLGFLVFVGLLFYGDITKIGPIFAGFKWYLLPLILSLTIFDDLLRFLKWDYLLSAVDVDLSRADSASVFFGGLAMAITPGKVGELFKSFLVKRINGTRMSRTMPVVVVERLTDLIAVTLLASIGALYFSYGLTALIVIISIIVFLLLIVQNKSFSLWIINKIESVPLLGRYAKSIKEFYESSYRLLKVGPLTLTTCISLISWGSECLALFLVFYGLGITQSFLLSTFVFSFSSVMGALSMLPGGIGVAEGSMTGIMIAVTGMGKQFAVAATLIIRFSTLWFAVLVGLGVLAWNRKRFRLTVFEENL